MQQHLHKASILVEDENEKHVGYKYSKRGIRSHKKHKDNENKNNKNDNKEKKE